MGEVDLSDIKEIDLKITTCVTRVGNEDCCNYNITGKHRGEIIILPVMSHVTPR